MRASLRLTLDFSFCSDLQFPGSCSHVLSKHGGDFSFTECDYGMLQLKSLTLPCEDCYGG